jgi:predicted nucleic acid-binding Zn ribbon protein
MTYFYICDDCKKHFSIDLPIGTDLPFVADCPNCKGKGKHDFANQIHSLNQIIPEYMKATSKYYQKDTRKLYKKDAAIEATEAKGMI